MPNSRTITLSFLIAAHSREYITGEEAAAFWHTADCLMNATGAAVQLRINTQYGETLLSRTKARGLVLKHKGIHANAEFALVGHELRFDAILHRGVAVEAVRLAAASTEAARNMGELVARRAA